MTETYEQSKRDRLQTELVDWVHSLAPWSLFFTGTFANNSYSLDSARRAFEKFMAKNYRKVSYFYILEPNPGRVGWHVHALLADCVSLRRDQFWSRWFKRFASEDQGARNKLEIVRSRQDVTEYCSKHATNYLLKGSGWYNFRLASPDLWHQAAR